MDARLNLPPKQRSVFLWLMLLLALGMVTMAFSIGDPDDFNLSRREILLRRIGHELLLQSGDSTSRVLPVKKIAADEYQLSFEREFAIDPNTLIHTTRRFLDHAPNSGNYIVTVRQCGNPAIAYGYAIAEVQKNAIITCQGRKQPKSCYQIDIKFQPQGTSPVKTGLLLGGVGLIAVAGFIFFRSAQRKTASIPQPTGTITLGPIEFDVRQRKLHIANQTLELTATETRVLLLLASAPNQTVPRARLQKEIWEDEGVIVGRSLDVFVSKLRKKLELEPGVCIVVVRGKGYRLEV